MSFSACFAAAVQIIFIFSSNAVYCVYPAMSQSPKQLLNCLNGSETSVALIIFNGVLCHIRVYSVKFTVGQHELGTRKTIYIDHWYLYHAALYLM